MIDPDIDTTAVAEWPDGREAVYAILKPYRMGPNGSAIPHVERFP
jgi:hypothetical protein